MVWAEQAVGEMARDYLVELGHRDRTAVAASFADTGGSGTGIIRQKSISYRSIPGPPRLTNVRIGRCAPRGRDILAAGGQLKTERKSCGRGRGSRFW
jgi:hypothetical protein